MLKLDCPRDGSALRLDAGAKAYVCALGCRYAAPRPDVVELHDSIANATSDHYTLQWGAEVDFASFYRDQRAARRAMTSSQMGWPRLIARVRARAAAAPVRLFDAACGYGGLFMDLFEAPAPALLQYVGADIHSALPVIDRPVSLPPDAALFVRWDISDPLPTRDLFDVIVCRAAIHHTSDPARTFQSLASRLAPGGTLAITAYAKKTPMREAVDDALRDRIVSMSPDAALAIARQFTILGRDLQASGGTLRISEDLPFIGIRAGQYTVHEFLYAAFMKCWFNPAFGERYSDIVNFDWYHPPYAYRFEPNELRAWFTNNGLEVTGTESTSAQHYVEGRRASR